MNELKKSVHKKTGRATAKTAPAGKADTYNISDNHPLFRCTKRQLIAAIESRTIQAQDKSTQFDLALGHFLFWAKCERQGVYASDNRDKRLLNGLQALRTSFKTIKI